MPDEPTAVPPDDVERERAIVQESVAALQGLPASDGDHPRERRRVRAVIEAIRAAR